jgi:CobQ-like glutamine amidotransferase family enzyme
MGGGQDAEQIPVATDLLQWKSDVLRHLASMGVPMLAVCAGYQLFGRQYVTTDGRAVPGANLLPITTDAQLPRLTGTVIGEVDCFAGVKHRLVGFENHAGRTELAPGAKPLARLQRGAGNNGTDKTEGVIQGSIVGTYLHGPVLSANPWLADALLAVAVARRGMTALTPLDDEAEERAAVDFLTSRSSSG